MDVAFSQLEQDARAHDFSGVVRVERLGEIVVEFAARLRPLGPFNFVYSDGDALFVHAHRR